MTSGVLKQREVQLALPMALLIFVREIDISVAAILAVSSVAMGFANQLGVPVPGLVLIGIAVGAFCGAFNGVLVTHFAIPSIVVMIGTMSLYRGIALVVLGDQAYTGYPEALGDWGQGYFFGFIPGRPAARGGYFRLQHFSGRGDAHAFSPCSDARAITRWTRCRRPS